MSQPSLQGRKGLRILFWVSSIARPSWTLAPQHAHGGQNTTLFPRGVLGLNSAWLGVLAGPFTHRAILLTPFALASPILGLHVWSHHTWLRICIFDKLPKWLLVTFLELRLGQIIKDLSQNPHPEQVTLGPYYGSVLLVIQSPNLPYATHKMTYLLWEFFLSNLNCCGLSNLDLC